MFVDASALIALVVPEPAAPALADALQGAQRRLCSPLSLWETVAGLCRTYMFSVPSAEARLDLFVRALELELVPLGAAEYRVALAAYAQFGTGRHPAALNMGDCFAYACARTHAARLLFLGNHFARTDIEAALVL